MTGRVYKFLSSVVSDVGVKRTENQDSFSIAHTREASLFVIADGMGGARGGATASALAASIVGLEAFNREGSITVESLRRVIEQANLAINARSVRDKDLKGMGTTIAALAFVADKVIVASVGDSRIYYLRGEDFRQITKDHTFVQELVEKGAIKLEEAASHPISHMLTRSLGPIDKVNVDTYEFENKLQPGDRFLICSDGLYNHVNPEEIRDILGKNLPEDVCHELLQMALERGGSDNITIQVAEVLPLNSTAFVFPVPEAGKVEVNLLGNIEEKEIGSEMDQEHDFFAIEGFDLTPEKNEPIVFTPEEVIASPASPIKFYFGGAAVVAVLAFFIFLSSQNKQKTIAVQPETAPELAPVETPIEVAAVQPDLLEVAEESSAPVEEEIDEPILKTKKEIEEEVKEEQLSETEAFNLEIMRKVEEQANSLEVPEAPKIKIDFKQNPPDQPIVWENEELKVGKVKSSNNPTKPTPRVEVDIDQDLAKILELKKETRQKISDLDFKLQLLVADFKKSQEPILNKDSENAKIAIEALKKQLLVIEQQLVLWDGIDNVYDQPAFVDYLEKTAKNSESINEIFGEYKAIDQVYKDAVKMWHQNPRDLSLASEMGAKARKRDDFFKSMQEKVKKAVDFEILKVLEVFADRTAEKENAEQLLQSLNRRKGYLQASFQLDPARSIEMREKYLAEREQSVAKLEKYKEKLSDEKEHTLQRNIILSELKSKL